jgi:hypothetical protein
MTKNRLIPNRLICSLIEDLEVHCLSYQFCFTHGNEVTVGAESCDWTGKLRDAESHYSHCPLSITTCPHGGCDKVSIRKDLLLHVENCLYRLVPCEWCNMRAAIDVITSHAFVCPKRPVNCPNGCLDENGNILSLSHDEVTHHRSVCIMEEIDCAFSVTGCHVRGLRSDILLHEKDAGAHIIGLLGAQQQVVAQVGDLKRVLMEQNLVILAQEVEIRNLKLAINCHCSASTTNPMENFDREDRR